MHNFEYRYSRESLAYKIIGKLGYFVSDDYGNLVRSDSCQFDIYMRDVYWS